MNTCNIVNYLDFDCYWTNISFTTPQSYKICRGVYNFSSFRPIIRSFVRQCARPFVNFTSKFVINPFDSSYLCNNNSDSYCI